MSTRSTWQSMSLHEWRWKFRSEPFACFPVRKMPAESSSSLVLLHCSILSTAQLSLSRDWYATQLWINVTQERKMKHQILSPLFQVPCLHTGWFSLASPQPFVHLSPHLHVHMLTHASCPHAPTQCFFAPASSPLTLPWPLCGLKETQKMVELMTKL